MRCYRFDARAGRAVVAYGSAGLAVTPILRPAGRCQVVAIHLEPHGVVGAHPAVADQLFLVVAGSGTFTGGDGATRDAAPGCAAFWSAGEVHETRAGPEGLAAIVLEAAGLGAAIVLPPWDG